MTRTPKYDEKIMLKNIKHDIILKKNQKTKWLALKYVLKDY